jgi:hypothetical protein
MAKSFNGWLPMWFNTKLKNENNNLNTTIFFQLFLEKMAKKMPQITLFSPLSGRNINQNKMLHGSSY